MNLVLIPLAYCACGEMDGRGKMIENRRVRGKTEGSATVEYAVFLAAVAVLVLSGVMILGDQLRPQMVAWRDNYGTQHGIDNTLVGSIEKKTVVEQPEKDGKKRYIIRQVVPELRK